MKKTTVIFETILRNQLLRRILPIILVVLSILFQFWNASRVGTFWDYQIDDAIAKLNLDWLKNGVVTSDPTFQTLLPYGYAVTYLIWIPAYFYSKFSLGIEFNIGIVETQNWIVYRNVISFAIFLIGIAAIVFWTKYNLKLNGYALTLLLLWCFPTVSGYGLFNDKDIPIFTGIACALALTAKNSFHASKFDRVMRILFVNSAILFVVGVRPGAAPLLLLIFALQFLQVQDKKKYLLLLFTGIPTLFYCFMVSASARNLNLSWFYYAIKKSTNFDAWQGAMLLWNHKFSTPISGGYYIGVIASQIPTFVIFTALAFFIVQTNRILGNFSGESKLGGIRGLLKKGRNAKLLPPLLLLTMIIYTLLTKPMLYDDARQLLFGWVFIIFTFLIILEKLLTGKKQWVFLALITLLAAFPALDSYKLAPFSYTYRNEIANLLTPGGFESDYWGLSGKENYRWIIENNVDNLPVVNNPTVVFQTYAPKLVVDLGTTLPNNFLYQQIRRPFGVTDTFPNCEIIHETTREQVIGRPIIMSYVKRCP